MKIVGHREDKPVSSATLGVHEPYTKYKTILIQGMAKVGKYQTCLNHTTL